MAKNKLWIILLFIIAFSLLYCDSNNKDKSIVQASVGSNNADIKIVNAPAKKKEKTVKIVYYKKLSNTTKKPTEPISKEESKKLPLYFKVGYSKKNKILSIKKYMNKKRVSSLYYEYNNRGSLIKKKFIQKKTKLVHYFNSLGKPTERENFIKMGKSFIKLRKEYIDAKGLITRVDRYEENKLRLYKILEYHQNTVKVSTEKNYRRDILTESHEEDQAFDDTFYLSIVRSYRLDGKLEKEVYYAAEEGKINHTKKYIYNSNGKAVIEEFDKDNKLDKKWYYDEKGKLIKVDDFDENGKVSKSE